MAISAAMVKELRESTGAGMMDAKKALEETSGDMEAAVDWLRTKGLAKAAKKSGRIAAERLSLTASAAVRNWIDFGGAALAFCAGRGAMIASTRAPNARSRFFASAGPFLQTPRRSQDRRMEPVSTRSARKRSLNSAVHTDSVRPPR